MYHAFLRDLLETEGSLVLMDYQDLRYTIGLIVFYD